MKYPSAAKSLLMLCCVSYFGPLQAQVVALNALSGTEKEEGWELLFDGKTLTGWRSYRPFSNKHWTIEEGCLKNPKGTGRPETGGGEILTTAEFADFDFRFKWRIAPAGAAKMLLYIVVIKYNALFVKIHGLTCSDPPRRILSAHIGFLCRTSCLERLPGK